MKRGQKGSPARNGKSALKLHPTLEDIHLNFQDYLLVERRMSPATVENYALDVRAFLFWSQKNGETAPDGWRREIALTHLGELRDREMAGA